MDTFTWFLVILAADLAAMMIQAAVVSYMKPKRGRPRKSRVGLAKIIPFRKAD